MASSRWVDNRQWGEGSTHMTQLSRGILAAVAISLSLGAVAWGRDLVSVPQGAAGAPETAINRIAKTDRAAIVPAPVQTRTIALRLEALADTSVLVRIPVATEARNAPSGPMINKSGNRKLAVACEPMVSVLTEVAKLLQPGRCVT
jgi:hypothetical protein